MWKRIAALELAALVVIAAMHLVTREVDAQQVVGRYNAKVFENEIPTGSGDSVLIITAAEIAAMIKAYPADDFQIKSTNAGVHVVDVWEEQRDKQRVAQATYDTVHSDITEIYYMREGSATLMTGAKMIKPLYRPSVDLGQGKGFLNIPSFQDKSQGGTTRRVGPGDVVVIPPWVVHQWRSLESPTLRYLNIRIDPEHKQPPNYVAPVLKKK